MFECEKHSNYSKVVLTRFFSFKYVYVDLLFFFIDGTDRKKVIILNKL